MVGFEQQRIRLQLQLHMPVAQVIRRAQQVVRTAVFATVAHHHHRLRRGNHFDQRAIFRDQHIAAAHHRATRQKHAQMAALRVFGVETAFLPRVPIQHHRSSAFEQHSAQAVALR